jgi:hypothetical protein
MIDNSRQIAWQESPCQEEELADEMHVRKEFIDYDARREPRTKRFCVRCQKDLDPGKPVRRVYLTGDMEAIHPDDFGRYLPLPAVRRRFRVAVDRQRLCSHSRHEWTLQENAARPQIVVLV